MPAGWFVPVKGSPPEQRKGQVDGAARKHRGKLHSFWERPGQDGYNTLIEGVPDDEINAFLAEPDLKPNPGHHKVEIH